MTTAIEITDLRKEYRGKRRSKILALEKLNFTVASGEVFGFLGPNGAGKSTLIKILMGLISPTKGTASLNGTAVSRFSARKSVGYLPENPAYYDFLSAPEFLRLVGGSHGMSAALIEQRSREVLEQVDLVAAAKRPIRSFSKGMVQRLGLAQTLLHDPDLYILDEPMSGLDPIGRAMVKEIIRGLRDKGKTIFFSTHITADVEAVCDRLGILVKGRLEALDEVENLMHRGVVGYNVHVRGSIKFPGAVSDAREISSGVVKYAVSRNDLNEFLNTVDSESATVELIETRRKDLESFFLEVVGRRCEKSQ